MSLQGVLANVVAVATETADTRSWLTLPSVISVTRVALKPGSHELKIFTDGRLDLEEIKLRPGEDTRRKALAFLRFRGLRIKP